MHKIHIYTLDVHAAETSNGFCCCILQAPKRNGLPVLTSRRNVCPPVFSKEKGAATPAFRTVVGCMWTCVGFGFVVLLL